MIVGESCDGRQGVHELGVLHVVAENLVLDVDLARAGVEEELPVREVRFRSFSDRRRRNSSSSLTRDSSRTQAEMCMTALSPVRRTTIVRRALP